jgi:type I restriction enzyme M protein
VAGNEAAKTARRTIEDFISGRQVPATPEERVVQQFTHLLVERYGYDKAQIHTRPQWRVPQSPSEAPHHRHVSEDDEEDNTRRHPGFPIEVVVFDSPKNAGDADHVYILAECKAPTVKLTQRRAEQLRIYMGNQTKAKVGVFYNGPDQRVFYKHGKNGEVGIIEIPELPACGEAPDLGGRKLRKDLRPADDLKRTFEAVRNYIHSEDPKIKRDEEIIREIVSLLICKIYDEESGGANEPVEFRWSVTEDDASIFERINRLYQKVREEYTEVFDPDNDRRLKLAPRCVAYFVKKVQGYRLTTSGRDAVGEAFETFIGDALKGKEGQYFTPRNVVDMMVQFVDPESTDRVIDPACGTGGFLVSSMKYVFDRIQKEFESQGQATVAKKQLQWARNHLRGIDADSLCTRFSKAYLAILGDGHTGLYCKDSLDFGEWPEDMKRQIPFGSFDIVLTNPPFGRGLTKEPPTVNPYDLGHQWRRIGKTDQWEALDEVAASQEESILFLELCLKLLKPGGRLGIVYVWSWLMPQYRVLAIVDIPDTTFKPYTHAKAQVVFVEKSPPPPKGYTIIMATARRVGKNSRGDPIYKYDEKHQHITRDGKLIPDDDLMRVTPQILRLRDGKDVVESSFGFTVQTAALEKNILIPRYYDKNEVEAVRLWARDHGCELVTPRQLIAEGILTVRRGHGSMDAQWYQDEGVPYVRTSNIGSLEVELFSENVKRVSKALYDERSKKLKIQANDLLFVKRGEMRIGNVAIVYPGFERFLVVSEVDVVRVVKPDNDYGITPFSLLYLLTHEQVKRQFDNKKFYETIIWNIADRWLDILLPIPKDRGEFARIEGEVREAVSMRADGLAKVQDLTHEAEALTEEEQASEVETVVAPRAASVSKSGGRGARS